MKQIAKKAGAATDTSRDYDYTDWVELHKFVGDLAAEIRSVSDTVVALTQHRQIPTPARTESHA
jgi:menaquinone-dependent protoporphyrinogen oxidase